MKVKQIIIDYLKENKFDGLHKCGECGCKIDDLIPCDADCSICEPGYLNHGDEEFDFYIGSQKEDTQ